MRSALAVCTALCLACGNGHDDAPPDAGAPPPVYFDNITAGTGIPTTVVALDPTDDPCATLGPACIADTPSFGVGAAAGDVDGDGKPDVYLGGPDGGQLILNRSDSTGISFVAAAAVGNTDYVHAAAFADLDGDGDEDLMLGTNAGLRVYEGDGSGGFTDVSASLGVTLTSQRVTSIAVADVNADGRVDVHVCDYGVPGAASTTTGPGMLLINDGQWRFHDVAAMWASRHDWASAFADVDGDGRLDLVIASETWLDDQPGEQPSSLLYNDGNDGNGDPMLVASPSFAQALSQYSTPMAVSVGDADGDGALELLVSVVGPLVYAQHDGARTWSATSFFGPSVSEANTAAWTSVLDDFDFDGTLDALVINGAPCVPGKCDELVPVSQPPRLITYRDRQFDYQGEKPIPGAGGMATTSDGSYRNGRGLVRADFDGDGWDELLVTPFNDAFRLYRRARPAGSTLRVVVPRGMALRVVATVAGDSHTRPLVWGGGTHSQSEPAVWFSLGDAATADSVTVHWLDGTSTALTDVAAGSLRVDLP